MCDCEKPTRNDELPYWDGSRAPELSEGDTLIYDECGRCRPQINGTGDIDYHSHNLRLVKNYSRFFLLVRHGGGDERIALGYDHTRIDELLEPMDSDSRFLMLCLLFSLHTKTEREAHDKEAERWQRAAADRRIKTRRMPKQGYVKVWIEPETVNRN